MGLFKYIEYLLIRVPPPSIVNVNGPKSIPIPVYVNILLVTTSITDDDVCNRVPLNIELSFILSVPPFNFNVPVPKNPLLNSVLILSILVVSNVTVFIDLIINNSSPVTSHIVSVKLTKLPVSSIIELILAPVIIPEVIPISDILAITLLPDDTKAPTISLAEPSIRTALLTTHIPVVLLPIVFKISA